jgi:uncharacterized phage protein (TIGR01671 family)
MGNREMKFRVWDKAGHQFVTRTLDNYSGDILLDLNGKIRVAEYPCGNGDNSANSVFDPVEHQDNFVIQQFTGLKDKDGREIYEGDIVKTDPAHICAILESTRESEKFTHYSRGEVKWWNEGFAVCEKGVGPTRISEYSACGCCPCGLEIIGNIFESPWALEKHD